MLSCRIDVILLLSDDALQLLDVPIDPRQLFSGSPETGKADTVISERHVRL